MRSDDPCIIRDSEKPEAREQSDRQPLWAHVESLDSRPICEALIIVLTNWWVQNREQIDRWTLWGCAQTPMGSDNPGIIEDSRRSRYWRR